MEINTIEKLILALDNCSKEKTENDYLDVMGKMQIKTQQWEPYFTFKDDGVAKVCISKTENYQLFLSCWEKGQQGPIHDIDSKEAWIHPIFGKFTEERFRVSKGNKRLEQVSSVPLTPQSYSYMQKPMTFYRYINSYENRSVCLHLYCPPVLKWREYDADTRQLKLVLHNFDKTFDVFQHIK
jgi:hypothetical protein